MAQNQWINITLDPAASKKPDNADHVHTALNGTAAAGDVTLSFDRTKITSASLLTSAVMAALKIASGQLPK